MAGPKNGCAGEKEAAGARLILASQSPRRREILAGAGFRFEICPSGADEDSGPLPPGELVGRLAERKAADVLRENPDAVVVGSDTVVALGGEIFGKPKGGEDAARMLRRLSGREHTVYTGVAVLSARRSDSFVSETAVRFRALDDELIRRYVATGEPLDKAGAYGIQGRGALLVDSIEGDFFTVMGLPVARLAALLAEAYGIRPF